MAQVLLLSRLHHRNLVRLEGFCDESGLQVRINCLFLFKTFFVVVVSSQLNELKTMERVKSKRTFQ